MAFPTWTTVVTGTAIGAVIGIAALSMGDVSARAETAGKPPWPEASFLKIKGTEVQQGLTELLVEAIGPYAAPFQPEAFRQENWNEEPVGPDYGPPLAPLYFNWRKASIYGGSNEIQRSIIAKSMLGL